MNRIISMTARPVIWVSKKICTYNHRAPKIIIGVCLAFGGGWLACNPIVPHHLHFVWDTVSYGVHAAGLAPVLDEINHHIKKRSRKKR